MMVGPILSWTSNRTKTLRPDLTNIIEKQNYVFQFIIENIEFIEKFVE